MNQLDSVPAERNISVTNFIHSINEDYQKLKEQIYLNAFCIGLYVIYVPHDLVEDYYEKKPTKTKQNRK